MESEANIAEQLLDACLNDFEQAEWIIAHYKLQQHHHHNHHSHQNQLRPQNILNWQEKKGANSILHIIVYQKLHHSVELLLKSGADPNIVNKNGETPLHWAIRMNSFECARLLIHHSANVNKKDKSGSTPLHLCCAYGLPELIQLLLSSGSHLNTYDKDHKTPLDLAEEGAVGDGEECEGEPGGVNGGGANSDAYLACVVLLRRHIEHFQSAEKCKILVNPPQWPIETNPHPSNFNNPESSPTHSKKKTLPPFIAGSTMRVSQWEWQRAMAEYTSTPQHPNSAGTIRVSPTSLSSPNRHNFNLLEDRPKSPPPSSYSVLPFTESQSKLTDPRIHSPLSQSLAAPSSSPVPISMAHKLPTLHSSLPSKQHHQLQPSQQKPIKKASLIVPFRPISASVGDVFLSVEMCSDCQLHNWSLWHDEDRYNGAANECLRVIIHDLLRRSPRIRLFAYKSKVKAEKSRERIGALEVVVAVKVAASPLSNQTSSKGWAVTSIFSKLNSQSWPKTSTFGTLASNFVNNILAQNSSRSSSRRTREDVDEPLSKRKIELMFAQWHDRLYGDFRIDEGGGMRYSAGGGEGEGDGEYPLPQNDPLQGSFLLPFHKSQSQSQGDETGGGDPIKWELLNMNHFLVYDGTELNQLK